MSKFAIQSIFFSIYLPIGKYIEKKTGITIVLNLKEAEIFFEFSWFLVPLFGCFPCLFDHLAERLNYSNSQSSKQRRAQTQRIVRVTFHLNIKTRTISNHLFLIWPESYNYLSNAMLWLTINYYNWCCRNLIYLTLAFEDANSKLMMMLVLRKLQFCIWLCLNPFVDHTHLFQLFSI